MAMIFYYKEIALYHYKFMNKYNRKGIKFYTHMFNIFFETLQDSYTIIKDILSPGFLPLS